MTRSWQDLPSVELTQDQFVRAARLAYLRDESFRKSNHHNSALFRHFQGCAGELAVAELYDLAINEEIYEGGDEGYDFELNGKTIDVKTTSYDDPQLWISRGDLTADVYVGAHVASNVVTLFGAAWREEVRKLSNAKMGCWVIDRDDLSPLPFEDQL